MLNICISLCYTGVSRALPDCLSKPNTCRACQFWWSHFFCFDKLLSDLNAESQGHPVSSSLHNHFNQKHFFLIPIQILKVFWLEWREKKKKWADLESFLVFLFSLSVSSKQPHRRQYQSCFYFYGPMNTKGFKRVRPF